MAMELGGSTTRSDINVTPLVDVVLVLLIIFMVMTPLLEKEMAVRVPETQETEVVQDVPLNQVVLTMFSDGRFFLNRERIPEAELPTRISRAMRASPERIAFINAGDDVLYDDFIRFVDLAKDNGVVTVGMLTEKPQDPETMPPVDPETGLPYPEPAPEAPAP